MYRIITEGVRFPIQPHQIDAKQHLFGAFDNTETETSAGWVIRFLQERGRSWEPFTRKEIQAFYARKFPRERFSFNRLVNPEMIPPSLVRAFEGHRDPLVPRGGGWIVEVDGKFHVTDDFVTRCFRSRPVTPPAQKAVA